MRNIFLICVVSQLLGCAALIERQLTRAQGTSELQPIVLDHFFRSSTTAFPRLKQIMNLVCVIMI